MINPLCLDYYLNRFHYTLFDCLKKFLAKDIYYVIVLILLKLQGLDIILCFHPREIYIFSIWIIYYYSIYF